MRYSGVIFLTGVLVQCSVASRTPPPPWRSATANLIPVHKPVNRAESGRVNYRLPKTIQPLHYNITLQPYLDEGNPARDFTFDGIAVISLRPKTTTEQITLHASTKKLSINSVQIKTRQAQVTVADTVRDPLTDFLTIRTTSRLVADEIYNVTITFVGNLTDPTYNGFYRGAYNENGKEVWMASTQFEPTSAREAFPCFDEPAMKATFDVNIVHLQKYTAVSNMRRKGIPIAVGNNRLKTSFERTPIMSTYLLAFVVSDYPNVTNQFQNQTLYCREGLLPLANRSINVAESTVKVIGSMLGTEFQLDKLDHVAISNFWAAAMENWGLITYVPSALLFNPEEQPSSNKESVVTTIIHEIGHQWFGNQVSPLWWKYTWLNEGFATYLMYFATNEVVENLHPEFVEKDWRMDEVFAVSIRQRSAFYNDFLMDTPITRNVESPNEVMGTFDMFSYNKGGVVLVMLEHILTTPIFRQGLNYYLNDKAYSNAEPADLWRNLQRAYDEHSHEEDAPYLGSQTVADIGNSWTLQGRVPVVMVSKVGKVVTFNQSKYLMKDDVEASKGANWIIPINYALKSKPDFNKTSASWFLTENPLKIEVNGTADDWIIVNNQQTGFYRVNYDVENWRKLINATRNSSIRKLMPKVTLAQLIDDCLDLCKNGHLSYSKIGMELVQFLTNETDYIPWLSALNHFKYLDKQLAGTPSYQKYKVNQLVLVNRTYYAVNGFNSSALDGHSLRIHRGQIVDRACMLGHQVCRKEAEQKLSWAMENVGNHVEPDLIFAVYCGGLRNGNQTLYEQMMERYEVSNYGIEIYAIVLAEPCFGKRVVMDKRLKEILNESRKITIKDRVDLLVGAIDSGPEAFNFAFEYLTEHIGDIYRNHGWRFLESLMDQLAPYLVTDFHRTTVINWRDYFKNAEVEADLIAKLEETHQRIVRNMEWNKDNLEDINFWLTKKTSVRNTASNLAYNWLSCVSILIVVYQLL